MLVNKATLSLFKKIFLSLVLITLSYHGYSQLTNLGGIINTYYKVDSIWKQSCKAFVQVQNTIGLDTGDEVLIIQMQGAVINTSYDNSFGNIKSYKNAGNYELAEIKKIVGNIIELKSPIIKYYSTGESVQLVKVAKYKSAAINALVTALPWDGNIGGIIAIDVQDTLVLNRNINAGSMGFRGGNLYPNEPFHCGDTQYYWTINTGAIGMKGEGITRYDQKYEAGIMPYANGGGGGAANNSGGGGGGHVGNGGNGGFQSSICPMSINEGVGGKFIDYYPNYFRIYAGGGGGAGQQDNGFATPGMNGGGIILIRANYLVGNNNAILSQGGNQTNNAGNGFLGDGGGGGGAGGSVLLEVNNYVTPIFINVAGGNGGNTFANDPLISTGPGGGGGGGIIWHSGATLPTLVATTITGGNPGLVMNTLSPTNGTSYGAETGVDGIVFNQLAIPFYHYELPTIISMYLDTTICRNDTASLGAAFTAKSPYSVQWNPVASIKNSTVLLPLVFPQSTTNYILTITDSAGCVTTDSMTVYVNPLPNPSLEDSYVLQLGKSLTLNLPVYDSIFWAPYNFIDSIHSFSPIFSPEKTTMYRFYVTDSNGCVYYDSLLIEVKQCTNLEIPNIFTPNNDGVNDYFHIENILVDKLSRLVIYDRWGEVVFYTEDLTAKWDGTYKHHPADTDVYTYLLEGVCEGANFVESGNITLLR